MQSKKARGLSISCNMMDANNLERQFIFKEDEFEVDSFVPANFVAKYRKVNSLESLREQLVQYSGVLKQQLYNIINRDYKDFITISTKVSNNASPLPVTTLIFTACLARWRGYESPPVAKTTVGSARRHLHVARGSGT
jgi:hypothetical protein